MFYTIYKTTNLVNGKYYIGKHKTKNLDDGYIGSGKLLKRAVLKYGIDNFHKEILHICKNEKHMNLLETILVVPDPEVNYNLCEGGKGGWSFINRNNLNKGIRFSDKKQKSFAGKMGGAIRSKQENCIQHLINCAYRKLGHGTFKYKKHTKETKQHLSQVHKGKHKGELNSQFGTCWITNGIENRKIKKEEISFWMKSGYTKGRIIKGGLA